MTAGTRINEAVEELRGRRLLYESVGPVAVSIHGLDRWRTLLFLSSLTGLKA
jgi:hypothetical protein